MRVKNLIYVLGLLQLLGCASVNTRVYEPARLSSVNTWVLEFAYEVGSIERLQKSSGDAELKVVSEGHTPRDLQLRDDLYYTLKDEYAIPLVKTTTESSVRIQIHPNSFL